MFYFSDIDSYIEISSSLTIDKAFKNGFTMGFWFRVEELNGTCFEDYPSLFTFFCSGSGGFEAYFEGNMLYYKTMSGKNYTSGPDENNSIAVYEFEAKTWYNLFICHKKKSLKILVNGEVIQNIKTCHYPKDIDSGRLDKGFLCRKMTGQVSSILICSDYIDPESTIEIYKRYPKSIHSEKFMEDLATVDILKDEKIKDKIFGLYLPSRAFKDSKGDIFVEFCSHHRKAKLSSQAGVFCQNTQKNQFLFCGDVKALLPIMPLFQKIEDVELGKKTFQKFLDIILTFTQLLTQDNIKEFHLEGFFAGFFLLFYSIPLKFFTKSTIESLIDIRFNLKKDSQFFDNMMQTTDIWLNLDFDIQNFFWDYVSGIYSQDYKEYLRHIDIKRLLQIIKHLVVTKKGHCCEKHERIKDPRSARKSAKYLPVSKLGEYIRPILQIVRNILRDCAKGNKDTSITKGVIDLVSIITHKQTPCYRIEILKVIKDLVSDSEPNSHTFKKHLKDEKHYFMILKVFNESYYDVQTHCVEVIKLLDLDQSIKEKCFSFMNYSVCPPDQRDVDVSLEDMTAYHTPVFKNQVRNILDHSEQMRSRSSLYRDKKVNSNIYPSKVVNEQEEMKYERKPKVGFVEDYKSNNLNMTARKFTDSGFSEDQSEDFSPFLQSVSSRNQSSKEKIDEETKNSEETMKETGEEDPLDLYLRKIGHMREIKESPIASDDMKIEVNPHRKSGKSSSPNRQSVPKLEPATTMIKESTNIPLTSSLSSDGNSGGQEQPSQDDFIIEELNDLYHVFLSWIFSSRDEIDCSRTIRYSSVLPLCLNLAAKSTKLMKQKVISDFTFMTSAEKNASIIMKERTFGRWILDTVYSVFPPKKGKELDPIWEMGCKLYTQMTKACLNSDSHSHLYIHQLLVWPMTRYLKSKNTRDKAGNNIKIRERMARTILCSFLDTISSNKEREKWIPSFSNENPFMKFWKNMTQIMFYVEELVLSFKSIQKAFSEDTPTKTNKMDISLAEDFSSSILDKKTDRSLFESTKSSLFISSVSDSWQDAKLLDMMFEILEPVWTIKSKRRSSKIYKTSNTLYKASNTMSFKRMGYNQIEDQVLDCLDEISSQDASEKIQIFLMKKSYPEESKKHEKYNFTFLKTVVNTICVRISLERSRKFLFYYCKMLGDIAECCVYISQNYVSQKSDSNCEVQIQLTKAVAFIIYFLHCEIRCRDEASSEFLCNTLDSIMSTIFVIILKKYPKDHEHSDPDLPSAKLVTILLNGYFEKADATLLFIRKDLENYQARDYKDISPILCSDQCSDFFEESTRFSQIRKEFCKPHYCEIISRERYSYAKKVCKDQKTWDYQEKKKYQEISSDITDKHNRIKTIEDYNKKDIILWIDHRQRKMKRYLKKMYNDLFLWKGVWRNKKLFDDSPEDVPLKTFNFITKNLAKPVLKNYPSQSLLYYDGEEAENILKRKHISYSGDNWRLLNCDQVFEDKIYITLKNRFFSRKMTLTEMKELDSCYSVFLEKYIFSEKEKDHVLGDYKCTQITPMYSKTGRIILTRKKLVFLDSIYTPELSCSSNYSNSTLDFFTYQKKPYKLLFSSYSISDLRYTFRRKFLFDHTCVDLIFKNCESLTLNFKSTEELAKFLKNLVEVNPSAKTFLNGVRKSKATEKWKRGEISNYFYLMILNYTSSRSYNDLSQYPVIPWFVDHKLLIGEDFQKNLVRDFEKNLNVLGGGKRLDQAIERFYEEDGMEDKYFSGTHYSNPGVILQYLVRIPPFLDGLIKFQSGKLDCADRMFSNLAFSYKLALTEVGDMRELIPESVVLPEMYKNHLRVNFGETQDGDRVNHVILPKWANEDPYLFTCKFREILESEEVSENIQKWVDLIFGYKQRGEAAVEACNLFPSLSYDGSVDMTDPENIAMKDSLTVQLYNYGQCPLQIFNDPHPQKEEAKGPLDFINKNADLQAKPIDLNKAKYGDIKEIKFVNNHQFYMIYKRNRIGKMVYNEYLEGSKKAILADCSGVSFQKVSVDPMKIHQPELVTQSSSIPISTILVKNDLQILIGGFWDGMMVVQNFSKKKETGKKKHLYRITMIEASQSENIIITGTEKGDIAKWVNYNNEIKFESLFFHHQNEVTGCSISEDMGLFATSSKDGTANLYVISASRDPQCGSSKSYILRSFRQPDLAPLEKVLISESPLAAVILLTEDLKCMTSYSVNGRYLASYDDFTMIENPMIIVDEEFNDKLVYGNTTGKLVFLKLPYFTEKEPKLCFDKNSVTPLCLSPDKKILIFFQDGLCCIGDFSTNIRKEKKEFKNIFGIK